MLWFNFILVSNFLFFCFKLIIIHYRTQKRKKGKFELQIKLNHKFSAACLSRFILPNCEWGTLRPGGCGFHIKVTGMHVVSLRGEIADFVLLKVFGMESHYICPFRYRLGLCIKKFTKNAIMSVLIWSPLGVSLSLSHTHIGLP